MATEPSAAATAAAAAAAVVESVLGDGEPSDLPPRADGMAAAPGPVPPPPPPPPRRPPPPPPPQVPSADAAPQRGWRAIIMFPTRPSSVYAHLIGKQGRRIRLMCQRSGGCEIRLHPQQHWAEVLGTPAQVKRGTLLLLLEIAVYDANLPRLCPRPFLAGFARDARVLARPEDVFMEAIALAATNSPGSQYAEGLAPRENDDQWKAYIMFPGPGRIPLHGFLIGRNGEHIAATRTLCGGPHINIQDSKGRVAVCGTRPQVESAVLLLLAQMSQYAGGPDTPFARPFLSGMWNQTVADAENPHPASFDYAAAGGPPELMQVEAAAAAAAAPPTTPPQPPPVVDLVNFPPL